MKRWTPLEIAARLIAAQRAAAAIPPAVRVPKRITNELDKFGPLWDAHLDATRKDTT